MQILGHSEAESLNHTGNLKSRRQRYDQNSVYLLPCPFVRVFFFSSSGAEKHRHFHLFARALKRHRDRVVLLAAGGRQKQSFKVEEAER